MNEAPQAKNFGNLITQPTLFPLTIERISDPAYSQKITKDTPKVRDPTVKNPTPYIVKSKNNVLGLGQMN